MTFGFRRNILGNSDIFLAASRVRATRGRVRAACLPPAAARAPSLAKRRKFFFRHTKAD